jgi:hypothetical protein
LNIDTRFSWKEKLIDDKFLRVYMATDYPIIHVTFGGGEVFYNGQTSYYGRILSTVKQGIYFGQTYFHYALEGGMYFGKLPYTMLDIPRGNETQGYFSYELNMLNYLEYVARQLCAAYLEYHLNGFFFNRCALLKRVGAARSVFGQRVIGSLSNKHRYIL